MPRSTSAIAISLTSARNSLEPVFLSRSRESLCWMSRMVVIVTFPKSTTSNDFFLVAIIHLSREKSTRADGATFPEATVIKTTHYRGAESPREPALRESSPQPVLVTPGLPLGRLRCSAGRECTETPLSDPDVSMESPQLGISPRKGRSGYRQRIPQGLRASVSIPYRACSRALQGEQTGLN